MSLTAETIADLPVALTLVYYADPVQRPTLGTVMPLPTPQARLELLRERDEEATWEDAEWR
jgi:hypothetical protein